MLSPLPYQLIYALFCRYFILLSALMALLALYCTESYSLLTEKRLLEARRDELIRRIDEAKALKVEAEEQLASASDIQSQELTLIRLLGVVPQDWKKVIINR